jgi:hypothetical protein
MGLVLEWVYGTIVSTAEKARDGAKRQLGLRPPTAQAAFDALLRCLEEQATWEQRARASKELLNQVRLEGLAGGWGLEVWGRWGWVCGRGGGAVAVAVVGMADQHEEACFHYTVWAAWYPCDC